MPERDIHGLHCMVTPCCDCRDELREQRLRHLVGDWQANGNSRPLGDPTAAVWHEAAQQLLAALDGPAMCACGHTVASHQVDGCFACAGPPCEPRTSPGQTP